MDVLPLVLQRVQRAVAGHCLLQLDLDLALASFALRPEQLLGGQAWTSSHQKVSTIVEKF